MNSFTQKHRFKIFLLVVEIMISYGFVLKKTVKKDIELSGYVRGAVELRINGRATPFSKNGGYFTADYRLSEGYNTFVIKAVDDVANVTMDTEVYLLDNTPPNIQILSKIPKKTRFDTFTLNGYSSDARKVTLNGQPLVIASGYFSKVVHLVSGGNKFKLRAVDDLGNDTIFLFPVILDRTPPVLNILNPHQMAVFTTRSIIVTGTVQGARRVNIDGNNVPLSKTGSFAYKKNCDVGMNNVVIIAEDELGNRIKEVRTFLVENPVRINSDSFVLEGDTVYTKSRRYEMQGRVDKNNVVFIDSNIVKTDSNGFFKKMINLKKEGVNRIKVNVYEDTF